MRPLISPILLFALVFLLAACTMSRGEGAKLSPSTSTVSAAAASGYQVSAAEPTVLPPTPLCQSEDLSVEVSGSGTTGAMSFTLRLVNAGGSACVLEEPPAISLIAGNNNSLKISNTLICQECTIEENQTSLKLYTSQSSLAPVGTYAPGFVPRHKIGLETGQGVNVFLTWENWCEPFPASGIIIQLTLPENSGILTIPTDATVGPTCDSSNAGSTLTISEYQQ
jgi:hypothetical protein